MRKRDFEQLTGARENLTFVRVALQKPMVRDTQHAPADEGYGERPAVHHQNYIGNYIILGMPARVDPAML